MSNEGHDSVVGRCEGFFSLKLEIPSVFDLTGRYQRSSQLTSHVHSTDQFQYAACGTGGAPLPVVSWVVPLSLLRISLISISPSASTPRPPRKRAEGQQ